MKLYDAIIIGFDRASRLLAVELTKQSWSVALIANSDNACQQSCFNTPSAPILRLLNEAHLAKTLNSKNYDSQAAFYKEAIERKNRLIAILKQKNRADITSQPNITLYDGIASFVSTDTIHITNNDEEIDIQGKEIFINTGMTDVVPAIDGIDNSRFVYTTNTLLEVENLPKHLIIVSSNSLGLEFASMYANFGSKVTIINTQSQFMPHADRDIANCVQSVLEKNNIEILNNCQPQNTVDGDDNITINFISKIDNSTYSIVGDALLAIEGEKPFTKDLNLSAADIKTNENGAIITNNHLHTTLPNIWAMGSVRGVIPFTYTATDDCRIILDKLFGKDERTVDDRDPVPYSIYIDPFFAHVGITVDEAQQRQYRFRVSRVILDEETTNQPQTNGIMKAIINTDTNRIIGCTLFCDNAIEMINLVNMAMKSDLTCDYLRDFLITHPNISKLLSKLFA